MNYKVTFALLFLCLSTAALADDGQSAAPNQPIQLTVSKVELGLTELRDIGLDLKHVLSSCRHLYDEVTLQPVSLETEPEMIANGGLISIPIATQPVGPPAPPRKERVDMLMGEISPVIALLKKNVDDFVAANAQCTLTDEAGQELSKEFSQWVALVNDASNLKTKLQSITQGPPYDNYAIAAVASALEADAKKLEAIRHSSFKALKKEGKALKD
jgi:hypothetical protein